MSDIRQGLDLLRHELVAQQRAIEAQAKRVGCSVFELQDTHGGFVLAPVLVALANVEVALQAHRHPATCGELPSWGHTFPCVLLPGHPMPHADRDGDEWHA
jgi:hypothetical protein